MTSRLRTLFAHLVLAVGALLAVALVLEVLLRLLLPIVFHPRVTKIDSVLGWYHNASVATISSLEGHTYRESYNRHGYRSPEHPFDKRAGMRRIVIIGDSFIDGSEVGDEELLTWHLQQAMSGVDVVNLGVYGYSTAQELLTLQHVAFRYSPDLVVLVTVTNDFEGNALNVSYFGPAPRFILDGDSVRLETTTSPAATAVFRATNLPAPGMSFLHEHSLLYYMLNHSVYQKLIRGRIERELQKQRESLSGSEKTELYRRLVQRMKRLCDERGTKFLVVFAYERPELRASAISPNRAIRVALAGDGVATLDLFTDLRDAELSADSSLYYVNNIHWNARGHRIVADLLRPELERRMRNLRPTPAAPFPRRDPP